MSLFFSEEMRAYTIVELEKKPGVGFGLTVSGKLGLTTWIGIKHFL